METVQKNTNQIETVQRELPDENRIRDNNSNENMSKKKDPMKTTPKKLT